MESVRTANVQNSSAEPDKRFISSRLRDMLFMTGACLVITSIFIGIGIGIPWALLPAFGGIFMEIGYNWGYYDRQNREDPRGVRTNRKRNFAAVSYSGTDERCGDSCGFADLGDGRKVMVLSDGTGKGEAAAKESSRAVNAILGLLKAGMDPELALQVLNLILSMDNRKEHFPTMDLALLDQRSRELYVYKIGASPTMIRRATGHCEIFNAPAMPMGVMGCSSIPCISTLVMPGDLIIMMTDGITDAKRDDPELKWLQRMLGRIKSRASQTVCDLIIREAVLNYGRREKDDMSIILFEAGRN